MIPLPTETTLPPSPGAANRGKFFLYTFAIIFILAVLWAARQPHVQAVVVEWNQHSLWENVKRLVGGEDLKLAGEADDRVNFLVLGQGGAKHDGPYLTDTIMVVSLKPSTNQVAMISLPRDLLVPIPGYGLRKINNANAFGEKDGEGKGAELARQVVEQVLDLPIHYHARLSFTGFVDVIDQLGGLPVNVERTFTDSQYPTDYNGMTAVSFEAGWQIMSGEEALQFVRSRHGNNNEGSDFARAKRQQQVLLALKEKLLSPATFLNPSLSMRLYRTLSQSIETDLTAGEAVRLAHMLRRADTKNFITRTFDANPGGLLQETTGPDGAYLLTPIVPDFLELQEVTLNIFEREAAQGEHARLAVENGTSSPGLAEATSQTLAAQGLTVTAYGNAVHKDFPRTLIYDYTGGDKPLTRERLEALFGATAISLERTAEIGNVDFRIVLGADRLPVEP